jgi:tryptophanyl-tRNA synthetase
MTQYKEKAQKHSDNINSGLFTYPILMAADILLYDTDLVPVGEDQKQHLELSRDIAIRFNNAYGRVFTVPEAFIPKAASRVMDLQNPLKKMSKSDDDDNSYVLLLDSPDLIMKKFKRAVTDSESRVVYDKDKKPGIANLMEIYSAITDKTLEAIETEFENKGYGAFKTAVGESVAETLKPLQARYQEIMNDRSYLEKILSDGSQAAKSISYVTLKNVYERLGLYYIS